jgi:acyl-coenzyme A synthetase/AMP-(fatty) acid ligase
MGECVVAVVQPADWADAGPALADDILRSLQGRIGRIKQPRQIDFVAELPRHPTGKLLKRLVRERYWPA